jgi:HEAT repeat protein
MKAFVVALWAAAGSAMFSLPCPGAAEAVVPTEDKLIETLRSNHSLTEKDQACALLWRVGTAKSVTVLAELLAHPELSHSARLALTAMPAPEAGEALIQALDKTSGLLKAGIISSLGDRRQASAVAPLSRALEETNGTVANAAAKALGQIGTSESMRMLSTALASSGGTLRASILNAILACSDRLIDQGKGAEARTILQQLTTEDCDYVRLAAHRALFRAAGDGASAIIAEALIGPQGPAQTAAIGLIHEMKATGLSEAIVKVLPQLRPETQVAVIHGLAQRGELSTAPVIAACAQSPDSAVRLAALSALGLVGDSKVVPLLVSAAAGTNNLEQAAARTALIQLRPGGVDEALLAELKAPESVNKVEAARALAERGEAGAIPALLGLASSNNPAAPAALEALAALASPKDLPSFVTLIQQAPTDDLRAQCTSALERAVIQWQAAGKQPDPGSLSRGTATGTVAARGSLLRVCGLLPVAETRAALRKGLSDSATELRLSAAEGLCETTDPELIPDLCTLATSADNEALRTSAARAVTRIVTENAPAGATPDWRLKPLQDLLASANLRVEQARVVLAGIAEIPGAASLQAAQSKLGDPAIADEAARAVIKLVPSVMDTTVARRALEQVAGSSATAEVKKAAEPVRREFLARAAYLTQWQISGPYRQEGKDYAALFDTVFPPEQAGDQATWKTAKTPADPSKSFTVDLLKEWPGEQCVAYARMSLECPRPQTAVLELGSDDGAKIWLNGKLVHANNVARPIQPGSDKVKIALENGRNDLLLKITQNNQGWEFCVRLLAEDGGPLEGLTVLTGSP